jgi:hypothetical protein
MHYIDDLLPHASLLHVTCVCCNTSIIVAASLIPRPIPSFQYCMFFDHHVHVALEWALQGDWLLMYM